MSRAVMDIAEERGHARVFEEGRKGGPGALVRANKKQRWSLSLRLKGGIGTSASGKQPKGDP